MSAIDTRGEGSAERHEVVALARELGRRELAPHALELDERVPGALEAAWGRVTEVGFDRALLAVDDGGVGLDAGSLLLCLEEIAAGEAGVALLVLLANAALAALPPERAAQVGEGERWALAPSPRGRISLGALGADGLVVVEAPTTTTTTTTTMSHLPSVCGGNCDIEGGSEPVVIAVPAGAPGLEVQPCDFQLGLRAAAAARVAVSAETADGALPSEEAGAVAAASLSLLRAGAAAIARGVARRAQEVALEYAQERVQGGVAIVEHDAVRQMLAAMSVRLAANPAPRGAELDEAAALAAKVAATEAALATATDAVQVFGGTGYMHETGVEKLMRDAKYLQLWPEPNWAADDAIVEAALRG